MQELILGIWGYSADSPAKTHNASACLLRDGKLLAAVAEERLTRRKNEGAFPRAAIDAVLRIAAAGRTDISAIALAGAAPRARMAMMLKALWRTYRETGILLPNRVRYALLTGKKIRRTAGPEWTGVPLREFDHHSCHAAAAYYTGPFETATVVTLDGIGDSACCGTVYSATPRGLDKLAEFNGYYSPGILYSYFTRRFGFRPARHEGKITGLAAHGDPHATAAFFARVGHYDRRRHDFFSDFIPRIFAAASEQDWYDHPLDDLLDRYTKPDIAAGLQQWTEEQAREVVAHAVELTGQGDVCLAGGLFGNVRVNQRVAELPGVRRVYVLPPMGDEGLAAGAAYQLWAESRRAAGQLVSPAAVPNMFLGPEYAVDEMRKACAAFPVAVAEPPDLPALAAEALDRGKIVGLFHGRMEFGPRALCHRTLLADARDATINDWLNQRLSRTEFMPFAPCLLEEFAAQYLRNWSPEHLCARYMTITYQVTPRLAAECPAVTHVDGTARPQIVRREDDPLTHAILIAYQRRTGIPVLINTSFNRHEEPIVCSPADALKSLLEGTADHLILGPLWVTPENPVAFIKRSSPQPQKLL